MGKTYLRYVPSSTYGVVVSPGSQVVAEPSGNLLFTGQLENVGVWNVKRGIQVQTLEAPNPDRSAQPEVTSLAASPKGNLIAAGYADGMVRVFDYTKMSLAMVLNGHKKAVTALAFASSGLQLASGSKDTDVIVWDLVAEAGLVRFRGHKDEVTDVAFVAVPVGEAPASSSGATAAAAGATKDVVVSVSKDTLLKVWDLTSLTCAQTVVGSRVELWSLAASTDGSRIVVGGGDNLLRVWKLSGSGGQARSAEADTSDASSSAAASSPPPGLLEPLGAIVRQSHDRASRVRATADGSVFLVQSGGKTVEVYRRRSAAETRKRVLRRLKRHREKVAKREAAAAAAAAGGSAMELDAYEDGDAEEGLAAMGLGGAGFLLGTSLADIDSQIARLEREAHGVAAPGKKGAAADAAVNGGAAGGRTIATDDLIIAGDEFELIGIAQSDVKIVSLAVLPLERPSSGGTSGKASFVLGLANNSLQYYDVPLDAASAERLGAETVTTASGVTVPLGVMTRSLTQQGHASDVRAVAVSSDGAMLLSASTGNAKVWNARTGTCVRTLDLGGDDAVGLCVAFGPGNRHAIVGTKAGRCMLFDLASGDLLEDHPAHEGPIWSIAVRPDGRGMATGSADKEVKFWDFDLRAVMVEAPGGGAAQPSGKSKKGAVEAPAVALVDSGAKQLTLVHTRTLKVNDEVLCLRYSHHKDASKRLLAVSLLDATVKVFFDDTLKFFLSLYGHKLPVMAMDVSADNTLLVTASADKNVKLWGLDFGDCHRSFFAHSDSVMGVGFVASTHYFFTASKDRGVKYWDGDRFEQILSMPGHHKGEIWSLAVSPDGTFFVTASHDRSLRVWRRTEEQVFIEEEREKEMEAAMERDLKDPDGDALLDTAEAVGAVNAATGEAIATVAEGDTAAPALAVLGGLASGAAEALGVVAHATKDTAKGTDRLLEALALAGAETDKWTEYMQDVDAAVAAGDSPDVVIPPTPNVEMLGLTPAAYVLRTLRALRPSDVDQVILVLPFAEALRLLGYLHHLLRCGQGVELCAKCALLLLRVHGPALTANQSSLPLVTSMRDVLHAAVAAHRDAVGFNIAGLRYLDGVLKAAADTGVGSGVGGGKGWATGGATTGDGVRVGKRRKVHIF